MLTDDRPSVFAEIARTCQTLPNRLGATIMLILVAVLAVGCSESAVEGPETLQSFSDRQLAQKTRAEETRDQMFNSLLSELMQAMAESGPAKSIQVCKSVAPEVADQLSKDGVRIGRTSFKLRNSENQPPGWASSFVSNRVSDPTYVALENEKLGALLPIRMKSTCLMCHGSDQDILPEVKAAIVSNYPKDKATGFAEGDLRGYFWIEVE
jgi:hypothetical protein